MKLHPDRKLHQNTIFGLRHRYWTYSEAIAYFLRGVARELDIAPVFFKKQHEKQMGKRIKKRNQVFTEKWLKQTEKEPYLDICGVKLPDLSIDYEKLSSLDMMFDDTFLVFIYHNDDYRKSLVEALDKFMLEGPYGYTDLPFDVTIKKDDTVIDAGAWIGDFSAYAAFKGATVYAFEPVNETFQWLCKTQYLNELMGGGDLPHTKRIRQQ